MQTDPNWANFLWDDKKQKVRHSPQYKSNSADFPAATTHRLWRNERVLGRVYGQVASIVKVGYR